jgi:predicted ATP-dependent endonuclease of OLD family
MLLTKIEITDFLSIKGTLPIDLDRKVTIMLGSNDHGKSNILRAVQHLNDGDVITDDESNWDATEEPRWDPETAPALSFTFTLTQGERREWRAIVEDILREAAESLAASNAAESDEARASTPEPTPTAAATSSMTASAAAKTAAPPKKEKPIVVSATDGKAQSELPESALDPAAATLTLTRRGVGGGLQFSGVGMKLLPDRIRQFFKDKKPRVELFEALGGSLQDSATAETIGTPEYEFLQGVFFYADLDPMSNSAVFKQSDRTSRVLDTASQKLDVNLRSLWGQGTDLHFHLRHKGDAIEFLADDPAIKSRKARMSKRSAGVTQFFRVSMVLHARRKKNPANSYIYLFDEPGVFLHPQGQRDLLQVFEQLADQNQIAYATHSLFLLNQNYPERHRLIRKDEAGTQVDQKPYRQNWKLATDALGVYLTSNILFSNKVLFVEGDSDPMYVYELFRELNKSGDIDADLNALGVMGFYDYQNLRFLLQVFKKEGQGISLLVLTDGDPAGRATIQRVSALCKRLEVPVQKLSDGRSIEDYCLYEDEFLQAIAKTLQAACEAEGKPLPKDLTARIAKSWEDHKASGEKAEKRPKSEKAEEKDEKKEKRTTGRWFKDLAKELIEDEASKVVLARTYAEICREVAAPAPNREKLKDAKAVCSEIAAKLALPAVRAVKEIEAPATGA